MPGRGRGRPLHGRLRHFPRRRAPGAAAAAGAACPGAGLRAAGVGLPGLERAQHRLLLLSNRENTAHILCYDIEAHGE